MGHPADEKTRQYLMRLMRETPDELKWVVRKLLAVHEEMESLMESLANVTTRIVAIKDIWLELEKEIKKNGGSDD